MSQGPRAMHQGFFNLVQPFQGFYRLSPCSSCSGFSLQNHRRLQNGLQQLDHTSNLCPSFDAPLCTAWQVHAFGKCKKCKALDTHLRHRCHALYRCSTPEIYSVRHWFSVLSLARSAMPHLESPGVSQGPRAMHQGFFNLVQSFQGFYRLSPCSSCSGFSLQNHRRLQNGLKQS